MRVSGTLAAVVVAMELALPTPAHAADAASATALAQLKSAQSTAFKALKLQLKTSQAVFFLSLKSFEGTLKSGGVVNNALIANLYADLITLQTATRDAIFDAFSTQGSAAQAALATLPGPLNGIYPLGFSPGDGGLSDQFGAQATAAVDKNVAALRKRLAKTTVLAEKAGFGLTFLVAAPFAFKEYRWTESALSYSLIGPADVDTVVAFSTLAASGDGRVRLAGFSDGSNGDTVTVDLSGSPNPAPFQPVVNDRRWSGTVDVSEGNFGITVQQEGDPQPRNSARIGVR